MMLTTLFSNLVGTTRSKSPTELKPQCLITSSICIRSYDPSLRPCGCPCHGRNLSTQGFPVRAKLFLVGPEASGMGGTPDREGQHLGTPTKCLARREVL